MAEEVLVENAISSYGLRRVHVMQMGKPVAARRWLSLVPDEAKHLANGFRWFEEDLDIYHLCLVWHAREPMNLTDGEQQFEVVLWFVDVKNGENLRFGVDLAAIIFERHYARQPELAVVRRLPENAPGWLTTEGGAGFAPVKVRLAEDVRIPERFVVMR